MKERHGQEEKPRWNARGEARERRDPYVAREVARTRSLVSARGVSLIGLLFWFLNRSGESKSVRCRVRWPGRSRSTPETPHLNALFCSSRLPLSSAKDQVQVDLLHPRTLLCGHIVEICWIEIVPSGRMGNKGSTLDQGAEWEPDEASRHCRCCGAPFGMKRRRHHCRRCGRLVCGRCAPKGRM